MSSKNSGGLGDFNFGREEAAQQLFRASGQSDGNAVNSSDQQKRTKKKASNDASYKSSNRASIDQQRKADTEDTAVTTPHVETAPAPPPKPSAKPRVQFNTRIKPDRREILDRYQREHNTTAQAVVDQMVDEYLERRGLLPENAD